MTIEFIWAWGGLALATIVCVAALIWGGSTERMIAITLWVAWVVSILVETHGPGRPGILVILIDVFVLFIFIVVSLKTRRPWTLFAAASQVDDVASHFGAQLLHYGVYSYITATGIWGGYFLIGCIVAGILGHQTRQGRAVTPLRAA